MKQLSLGKYRGFGKRNFTGNGCISRQASSLAEIYVVCFTIQRSLETNVGGGMKV